MIGDSFKGNENQIQENEISQENIKDFKIEKFEWNLNYSFMFIFSTKNIKFECDYNKSIFYKFMTKIIIMNCILFNTFCLIISPIICTFLILFSPYLIISVKCDKISFYFIKDLV